VAAVVALVCCSGCGTTQNCSSNGHSSTNCNIGNNSPPLPNSYYSTPATGSSPAPPTSEPPSTASANSPYTLMYNRVLINMPGGTCTDQTSVDFDYPNGPEVNPSNLFNNSSNNDIEMDNCADPNLDQTLKSQWSSISTDPTHPVTAENCLTAIKQRPDGTSVVPRKLVLEGKKIMCFQTSDGNLVLMEIKTLTTSPFQMQVYATAWRPNS
jgi:hypothetical protein